MDSTKPNANKSFLRLTLLLGGLCILGLLLYWQRSQINPQTPRHHVLVGDPIPSFEEAPMEAPDYLGGEKIDYSLDFEQLTEPAYYNALKHQREVDQKKRKELRAHVNSIAHFPLRAKGETEHEMMKRYYEYRKSEFESYEELTQDEGKIRDSGRAFLDEYLETTRNQVVNRDFSPLVHQAELALASGSQDPCIHTYTAISLLMGANQVDRTEQILQNTIIDLRNSNYPRSMHFALRSASFECAPSSNQTRRFEPLLVSIVRWIEEEANRPEISDLVWFRIASWWNKWSAFERTQFALGLVQAESIDPWLLHLVLGLTHQKLAWDARGNESQEFVANKQWSQFYKHLKISKAHLEYAWLLRSNHPVAPTNMIPTAMAGGDRLYEPRDWFHQALQAQKDFQPAYWSYWTSLRPRWNGSIPRMEQFLIELNRCQWFDTAIPYMVFDFVENFDKSETRNIPKFGTPPKMKDLCRVFLLNRAAYESRNPNEKLYGDTPEMTARISTLLKQSGMLIEAEAEDHRVTK